MLDISRTDVDTSKFSSIVITSGYQSSLKYIGIRDLRLDFITTCQIIGELGNLRSLDIHENQWEHQQFEVFKRDFPGVHLFIKRDTSESDSESET